MPDSETQKIRERLEHETVNLYAEEGIDMPYPEATWWKTDEPDFDIYEKNSSMLKEILLKLGISAVMIDKSNKRIFEARYEFPQYEKGFKYSEAVFYPDSVIGFIDFMGGVVYGCMEKLGIFGEVFSEEHDLGMEGGDKPVPPLPETLFSETEGVVLLFNKFWLGYENVEPFTRGLEGLPGPKHDWWTRLNLVEHDASSNTMPTPGEFVGTVIHISPNLPWGWQETTPFVFSGNWMETVFYSSAIVVAVIDSVTYTVQYCGKHVEAKASDYARYEVDDRVAVLKGVEHEEISMTWEDLRDFDETWWIVPMVFYQKEG